MNNASIQHSVTACVIALAALIAQTPTLRAETVNVVVRTVDSEALAGRLHSFSLTRGLRLEVSGVVGERWVEAADVVQIATTAQAAPSSGMFAVTLAGASPADRLVGLPGLSTDDHITVTTVSLGKLSVPLEYVATWRNLQLAGHRWDDRIATLTAARSDGSDHLLLSNGDRAHGVVSAIDGDAFTLERDDGSEMRIPHDRVVAAAIVHVPLAPNDGVRARIELVDGTRVTASALSWKHRTVNATILHGVQLKIEADRIVRIDVDGGRWRWLTELTPISSEQTPMKSVDWPVRIGTNVRGGALTCGGRSFDHGIGVHSRSRLTYDLKGLYREFVTSYGIDDDSGPLADVTVNIRVDGELRHARESVRRGPLASPVRIDIRRADRMELIVDFGQLGPIQDRFNWIDPALIR